MKLDQFKDVYLVIDRANNSFVQKQFVSQGDYKGRTLTVQVTNNGNVGEVPGLTLNLNWHNEASGLTDLTAFTVLDKANSIFRIEYPQNMMTPGKVYASIQVIQDGKTTNLQQFELIVQKLAGQPVGIPENAEFSALVAALADSNKFRTDIDAQNDAIVEATRNVDQAINEVRNQKKDLGIQKQRIDELTTLPSGSTSANAELVDIRVGQDGNVYSSAGKAVRNQLKRVNEHLKNLTQQSITTTPELISNSYIIASNGELGGFPNNQYAMTDYIELPAGLITISTTFTQRPDGIAGWAIYDVHKKFIRGGQTSEISNLDDSAYYIRISDYDLATLHKNCTITFVFNNFSTLNEILTGKATFSLEMTNDSYIDMTTGIVRTGVNELKLSTSRKRLIPEHALKIITNCTPRPYGLEGFAIYDGEGNYIQGGKLGVITSIPADARYISFTHYANMDIDPTVTFIYDRHHDAKSDLINLAKRTAIFTPELVSGWVGYDGSGPASPDDKYKCSIKFIPIPLNTKKITLNCNYNLASKAGWQIVDAKGKFIRGGQTNNIIIQPNDFAIAFTNYDSSETHAGIKMVCTIGVDSDDSPFEGKNFGFLGDSITHGLDPDHPEHTTVLPHPWANQVADALGANMINYGVNSATVVPVDNHPTPLIEKYKEMSPDLDYVIVMGGINDAFNKIPLGKMEDRDSSTFYGGLHILYKGLVQKYKRKDGKHVIVMTYPRYDALITMRYDVTFDQFTQAMRDVAGYYSIPILDLYNNCGISPFSDDKFEYWVENDPIKHDGLHNPHPRQSAANIIADTMCRYLRSSYME